jgi:hypothetical protein
VTVRLKGLHGGLEDLRITPGHIQVDRYTGESKVTRFWKSSAARIRNFCLSGDVVTGGTNYLTAAEDESCAP